MPCHSPVVIDSELDLSSSYRVREEMKMNAARVSQDTQQLSAASPGALNNVVIVAHQRYS